MALDPTKKKDPLNPTANLPAGVQAGMAAVKPQGTQIGNLTLIPGSGLDNAIKAIGQHQAGVTNTLAAADRLNATRPQFITPNAGQIPDKAFKAPLPLPANAPRPVIIDPANAASMQLTPPSKADVYPARNPAVPASSAGATAPGGGVPAPSSKPVSVNLGPSAQFGGGGVVRDSLASSVANGVPTYDNASITRLNARNASTQPAVAPGSPLGAAPAPFAPAVAAAQPNLSVPSLDLPSVNTLRTGDAERERAGLAKNIDNQLRDMNFAGLNSRGKRELYANLLRERSGLAESGGSLAGTAAQAQLDAATRAGTATQGEVGANNRAQIQAQTANLGTAADLFKANLDASKVGQMDANGNLLTTLGTPVTGADGKPVRGAQTKADGAITPVALLDANGKTQDRLQKSIDEALAMGRDPSAAQAALQQAQAEAAQLTGGAGGQGQAASAQKVSSKAEFDALPKGARFLAPDGSVRIKP